MGAVKRKRGRPAAVSGITKRWVFTTLSVITLILFLVALSSGLILRNYYRKVAENVIDSKVQITTVQSFFQSRIEEGDDYENIARSFIESFAYSNLMDVWVVSGDSEVIISSTGFAAQPAAGMPDVPAAMAAETGSATWIGRNINGEKVFSKAYAISDTDGDQLGAIRLIVSLQDVEAQRRVYTVLIILICAVALVMVYISGQYFIRSIVRPVGKINEAAGRIARGDFKVRVDYDNTGDEISELCSTINYMAEEIARTENVKNDFISTVSHELRTPLTAIKGWAETLRDVGVGEEELTKRGISVIIDEADRLYALVEDLLDFSRMESGNMVMRAQKTDLFTELNAAVELFRARAQRDGIQLETHIPDGTAPVMADAAMLKQIFANLLDNAFKYTPDGGRVAVFAELDRDTAVISIADTGCGIAPKDLPHVKEKFYKADVSVKGSGIGLAVVDEMVTLHGGTLDIASSYGTGTVVTVMLPLISEAEEQPEA